MIRDIHGLPSALAIKFCRLADQVLPRMVITVIVINLLIVLGCWLGVWQLWRLRLTLTQLGQQVEQWQNRTATDLDVAPTQLAAYRQSMTQLRGHYAQLQRQQGRLNQVLKVAGVMQWLWYRRRRQIRQPGTPH